MSTTFSHGDEVQALHTFNGTNQEDLSFKYKDILIIEAVTKDPNWYMARTQDGLRKGLIPANYIAPKPELSLTKYPWFHGKIDRQQTERLLMPRKDGLFLVRESGNYPGDYTLSVVSGQIVNHYRIKLRGNNGRMLYTVDDEEFFQNLQLLIDHYAAHEDGLCCSLSVPVARGRDAIVAPVTDRQTSRDELEAGGWVIRKTDVVLGELLGRGEFGEVLKGSYRGSDVAVKRFQATLPAAKDLKLEATEAALFTCEAVIMTSLHHKNLVRFLGVIYDKEHIYALVTEFMTKGSLVNYLRSRGRSIIGRADQMRFARDTVAGMCYLERQGLVHRDLAARNILLADDLTCKVADFGLAKNMNDSNHNAHHIVADSATESDATNAASERIPVKWTAPESFNHHTYSNKSDVWSFGILLWEIYSFGLMPYPRIRANQVIRHVEAGYRMEAPKECPADVYNVMKKCWQLEPEKRPSFRDIERMLQQLEMSPR